MKSLAGTLAAPSIRQCTCRGVPAPAYEVTEGGEIWSIARGRALRPWKTNSGYLMVMLRIESKSVRAYVHALVAEAFIGPRPPDADVCHVDGRKTANAASNLRYDSRSGNLADRAEHGTGQTGERNPAAKLSDEQAIEIRRRRQAGERLALIAAAFGVRESTVSRIANAKRRAI